MDIQRNSVGLIWLHIILKTWVYFRNQGTASWMRYVNDDEMHGSVSCSRSQGLIRWFAAAASVQVTDLCVSNTHVRTRNVHISMPTDKQRLWPHRWMCRPQLYFWANLHATSILQHAIREKYQNNKMSRFGNDLIYKFLYQYPLFAGEDDSWDSDIQFLMIQIKKSLDCKVIAGLRPTLISWIWRDNQHRGRSS